MTITANNQTMTAGDTVPALTATFTGFVNGETAAVLSGLVITTNATPASAAGAFPIAVSGAVNTNYAITFVPGTLTVQPSSTPATPATVKAPLAVKAAGRIVAFRRNPLVVNTATRDERVTVRLTTSLGRLSIGSTLGLSVTQRTGRLEIRGRKDDVNNALKTLQLILKRRNAKGKITVEVRGSNRQITSKTIRVI